MRNVLIGFEESQITCTAMRALGLNAFSCDLKSPSGLYPQYHFQDDFFNVVQLCKWDLIILHPPCTYTALSSNRWYSKSLLREKGALFTKKAWDWSCHFSDRVALEQPMTMLQRYIGRKSQVIHPWQYGHEEKKETWLWLKNLPALVPTNVVSKGVSRIYLLPPSANRSTLRSKTYEGIAAAFASQWGSILL